MLRFEEAEGRIYRQILMSGPPEALSYTSPGWLVEIIVLFFFSFRYGRVESVKILPKRSQEGGRAAFVDFVDIRSATKAHEAVNRIGDREMRTDYNEPGSAGNISRLHGHTDPPARTTSNSAPGSPVQRRRFDRRTEG